MRYLAFGRCVILATLVLSVVSSTRADDAKPAAGSLRVMSFNIRYLNSHDGPDAWDKRREMLVGRVKAYDPDLLGMQEVMAVQGDYVREQLPDYGYTGGGRDDGKRGGEASPIFYRKARFDLVEAGQQWLSQTPDVPGSKGWDAQLPRVITWAKLKDKATGKELVYFNTHWDHVGKVARVESGKLMRQLVEKKGVGLPVVVTGDFNSVETSEQYRTMTAGTGEGQKLTDAYRETHPKVDPNEASAHGFKGTTKGLRIDWILHSPEWKATAATIDRTNKDGRYPSDHYAVTADLEPTK